MTTDPAVSMTFTVEASTHPAVRGLLAAADRAAYGMSSAGLADLSGPSTARAVVGWETDTPVAVLMIEPTPEPGVCELVRGYVTPGHDRSACSLRMLAAAVTEAARMGYTAAAGIAQPEALLALDAIGLEWAPVSVPLDDRHGWTTFRASLT